MYYAAKGLHAAYVLKAFFPNLVRYFYQAKKAQETVLETLMFNLLWGEDVLLMVGN